MTRMVAALVPLACCALAVADGGVPVIGCSRPTDVRVTMYTGSDRALVREVCSVYLPAGSSDLRFRWTEADIDDTSVTLSGPPAVTLGGVRQVPEEPKTFIWSAEVKEAGTYEFVATYFLRGLKWSAAYYVTLDAAAGRAHLQGKLHLTNDSRYALRQAHLALCASPTGALDRPAEGERLGTYAVLEDCTLELGWQRRVTFLDRRDLPARVVYRADWETARSEVRRVACLDLRDIAVPGTLPRGHVEVYELLDGKRVPVLGTDLNHVADRETEIELGTERDIVFERKTLASRKTNVEFDRIGRVSGFDTMEEISDVVRNRVRRPVRVELVERVPGKWDVSTRTPPTTKEANEMRWEFDLQPDQEARILFTVTRCTGTRAD